MLQFLPAPNHYAVALEHLNAYANAVVAQQAQPCLWLSEHHHVYTAGTSANDAHLLPNPNLPVIATGRGGDYTYHGIGQRMIYPFLRLSDYGLGAREYMHALEGCIIDALATLNVTVHRAEGRPGVWHGNNKIAAVGVRVRRGVAFHGAALNVCPNLSYFAGIVPCGLHGYGVTSLQQLNCTANMAQVDAALYHSFSQLFGALPLVDAQGVWFNTVLL
jgi:lipoyl(octanoyl) transferase